MPFQRNIQRRRQEFSNAPKCRFCPVTSCNQIYSTRRTLERHLVANHGYTDDAAKAKAGLNNGKSDNTMANLAEDGTVAVEEKEEQESSEESEVKSPSPLNKSSSSSFSSFPSPSTLSTSTTIITTITDSSSRMLSFPLSTTSSSALHFSLSASGARHAWRMHNAGVKQCRACRSLIGHTSREDLRKLHGGEDENGEKMKITRRRERQCQIPACGAWFGRPTELGKHMVQFHAEELLAAQGRVQAETEMKMKMGKLKIGEVSDDAEVEKRKTEGEGTGTVDDPICLDDD
ncbi:hypothetical protein C8A03DRAFT_36458 [Achaetomium macrosporum]|uniref:C2H2-type domain-containing protein n=1 Tax=Achaetomium macrosporum TaxID=79813 RepID=A0AAN7C771_9PEZI|nr:hypothetical protein C8A03DRAFT_36458 [Achaetomium macrosporum]